MTGTGRSKNPEQLRRHKVWAEAEEDLRRAIDRIASLEAQLAEVMRPATVIERRDLARQRLDEAQAQKAQAAEAIERLETRLAGLETDIRETDGRMQDATRAARLAVLEGREHDLDGAMTAKAELERLNLERKTIEGALEEARRMYERASSRLADAASDLRHAEGEAALLELEELLRGNRSIVERIDAAAGVNEDRIMKAFNAVAREG